MLYPLKFKPILKSVIWGGRKLAAVRGKSSKTVKADAPIGESWEISGMRGHVSVVANGFLKSNNLQELIEVYMGDLVGDKVYEKFGLEFPVLIKFIDAEEKLSVQVHPDDGLAMERHGARGKTEMWYVVDCDPGASVYVGFNREVSREQYTEAVESGSVGKLLTRYEVKKGDVYFIPAGTVHAIGRGVVMAEIQQASDITYRIDDWGRREADGSPRKLHIEESVDAIDFGYGNGAGRNGDFDRNMDFVDDKRYVCSVYTGPDSVHEVVDCPWFTTNIVNIETTLVRDYASLDSFVACVCVEGELTVTTGEGAEPLSKYECLLIPAEIDEVSLSGSGVLLEVFMK